MPPPPVLNTSALKLKFVPRKSVATETVDSLKPSAVNEHNTPEFVHSYTLSCGGGPASHLINLSEWSDEKLPKLYGPVAADAKSAASGPLFEDPDGLPPLQPSLEAATAQWVRVSDLDLYKERAAAGELKVYVSATDKMQRVREDSRVVCAADQVNAFADLLSSHLNLLCHYSISNSSNKSMTSPPWELIYPRTLPTPPTPPAAPKGAKAPPPAPIDPNLPTWPTPQLSATGKYIIRLFYLNKWRAVVIDDRVPVDANGQPLLPISANPEEIWPLLVSKALLKLLDGSALKKENVTRKPPAQADSRQPAATVGWVLYHLCGWLPQSLSADVPKALETAFSDKSVVVTYVALKEKSVPCALIDRVDEKPLAAGAAVEINPQSVADLTTYSSVEWTPRQLCLSDLSSMTNAVITFHNPALFSSKAELSDLWTEPAEPFAANLECFLSVKPPAVPAVSAKFLLSLCAAPHKRQNGVRGPSSCLLSVNRVAVTASGAIENEFVQSVAVEECRVIELDLPLPSAEPSAVYALSIEGAPRSSAGYSLMVCSEQSFALHSATAALESSAWPSLGYTARVESGLFNPASLIPILFKYVLKFGGDADKSKKGQAAAAATGKVVAPGSVVPLAISLHCMDSQLAQFLVLDVVNNDTLSRAQLPLLTVSNHSLVANQNGYTLTASTRLPSSISPSALPCSRWSLRVASAAAFTLEAEPLKLVSSVTEAYNQNARGFLFRQCLSLDPKAGNSQVAITVSAALKSQKDTPLLFRCRVFDGAAAEAATIEEKNLFALDSVLRPIVNEFTSETALIPALPLAKGQKYVVEAFLDPFSAHAASNANSESADGAVWTIKAFAQAALVFADDVTHNEVVEALKSGWEKQNPGRKKTAKQKRDAFLGGAAAVGKEPVLVGDPSDPIAYSEQHRVEAKEKLEQAKFEAASYSEWMQKRTAAEQASDGVVQGQIMEGIAARKQNLEAAEKSENESRQAIRASLIAQAESLTALRTFLGSFSIASICEQAVAAAASAGAPKDKAKKPDPKAAAAAASDQSPFSVAFNQLNALVKAVMQAIPPKSQDDKLPSSDSSESLLNQCSWPIETHSLVLKAQTALQLIVAEALKQAVTTSGCLTSFPDPPAPPPANPTGKRGSVNPVQNYEGIPIDKPKAIIQALELLALLNHPTDCASTCLLQSPIDPAKACKHPDAEAAASRELTHRCRTWAAAAVALLLDIDDHAYDAAVKIAVKEAVDGRLAGLVHDVEQNQLVRPWRLEARRPTNAPAAAQQHSTSADAVH